MGIQTNLDVPHSWESRFLDEELIEQAIVNPAIWARARAELSGNSLGYDIDMAAAWAELEQVMVGRVATKSGLDSSYYNAVASGITSFARLSGAGPISITDLVDTTVGAAIDIIGAIPIVGPIVGGLYSVTRTLIEVWTNNPEPPPPILLPFQRYNQATDEFFVNRAMAHLQTFSWTDLFMPAYEGDWVAEQREGGWTFRPSRVTSGFGYIPGSVRCTSQINVWFTQKSQRDQRTWGVERSINALPVNFASSSDTGDFYPGINSLMGSVNQQCMRAQTQMWNIDVERIKSAWYDYMYGAFRFASDVFAGRYRENGLSSLTMEQREVLARAFIGQLFLADGRKAGPFASTGWYPGDRSMSQIPNIFDTIVKPWAETMKHRQVHNLGTRAMATAAEEGDAFQHKGTRDLLIMARAAMLDHRERWEVNLDDIVDPAFYQKMLESRGGSKFNRPELSSKPGPPLLVDVATNRPPLAPVGGYFGQPKSSIEWKDFLLMAAVLFGGYKAYKHFKK